MSDDEVSLPEKNHPIYMSRKFYRNDGTEEEEDMSLRVVRPCGLYSKDPKDWPPMVNDCMLTVANGGMSKRYPVWIMRQAGRYLKEFRAVRAKYEFFEVVHTPQLAVEVTLQPLRKFDLDAAIIFSDILVVPQALGMTVTMDAGKGPVLPQPLLVPSDANKLNWNYDIPTVEGFKGTLRAITLARHRINGRVTLIGFSGAPWTLLSYMIEGEPSQVRSKSRAWLYRYPQECLDIMNKLADVIIEYLVEQVGAGAQMLQVFDSHADVLTPQQFRQFCLPILEKIGHEVPVRAKRKYKLEAPMILFAKGANHSLGLLGRTSYKVIGVDHKVDMKVAREDIGRSKVLQGNLDPCALLGSEATVKENVRQMMDNAQFNHIFNLGHGILPDTPVKNVETFVEEIHDVKPIGYVESPSDGWHMWY